MIALLLFRFLILALCALGASSARARVVPPEDGSPVARCLAAVNAAGVIVGTPPGLLERIALAESGRADVDGAYRPWPWSIDADGADYAFPTIAQAVAWAFTAPRRGVHSLDAGCMQVNLQAHPHAFATLGEAFDPLTNALYAARYLRQLYDDESGGDWSVAVGLYHSHTPELAEDYRARVASLGAGIIAGLPRAVLAVRLAAIGSMRLKLSGGGTLRLVLNRQPAMPGHRRPTACEVAAAIGPLMASPARVRGCR